MRSKGFRILGGFAGVALLVAIGAFAGNYGNHNPINIPDATSTVPGSNTPHPVTSTIAVSEVGTVQPASVSVTLFDVTSEWPDDMDIYVSSPAGTKVMLWSDAGGDNTTPPPPSPFNPIPDPVDVTFSDAASATLPDTGAIPSGTYKPTNFPGDPMTEFGCDDQDPTGPFMPTLSSFNNEPTQGNWVLFAQDDCFGNTSQIAGGWQIVLNSPSAVRVHGLTASRTANGVAVRWTSGDESTVAGYNLYRGQAKVNRSLVLAKRAGLARGAAYRIVDRAARGGVSYRLQIVGLNGARTWAGSVTLGRL